MTYDPSNDVADSGGLCGSQQQAQPTYQAPAPAQQNLNTNYLKNFLNWAASPRAATANQGPPGGYKPAETTTNSAGQSAAIKAASSGLCGSGAGGAIAV